jgi:hypothetical protein
MDLLVVPPLTDFTTVPPDGTEVLDLSERVVERLVDPSRLRAAAARLPGDQLTALLERAAAAVLERAAFDEAHLRAAGTALRLDGLTGAARDRLTADLAQAGVLRGQR